MKINGGAPTPDRLHLVWGLDLAVRERAQGHARLNAREAAAYGAPMKRCWRVGACALKEAVRVKTRPVLARLRDDGFVAGHEASGAVPEGREPRFPCPWGCGTGVF